MRLKLTKITGLRQIVIILFIIFLLTLPVVLVQNAIRQTTVFYGIQFPNGVVSFADEVINYMPIMYLNKEGLPNVQEPFNNPKNALGIPNSSHPKNPFLSLNKRNDVSLGIGGSITLQFKDNLLTGSGDSQIDLWVFEAGEKVESVVVEISKDGINWHNVGETNEQNSGIDIDKFGWQTDDFFSYVRLTDNPLEGEHNGIWNEGEWIGWGGADIDSVGAISSVFLTPTSSNSSLLYLSVMKWALMMFATIGAGLGISYYLNKSSYF